MSDKEVRLRSELYYGVSFIAKGAAVSVIKKFAYGAGESVALLKSKLYNKPGSIGLPAFDEQSLQTNRSSIYGTPVMSNLVLGSSPLFFTYTDIDGNIQTQDSVNLECCVMTISRPKNTIKTVLEGRDGTVKQFISSGDYKIDVTAIIATDDESYPLILIDTLNNIFNIPDSIPVKSLLLNQLGISSVVIDDHTMTQEEGFYNQQKISFTMSSDLPINLQSVSS
jgi:hypothetical protein